MLSSNLVANSVVSSDALSDLMKPGSFHEFHDMLTSAPLATLKVYVAAVTALIKSFDDRGIRNNTYDSAVVALRQLTHEVNLLEPATTLH